MFQLHWLIIFFNFIDKFEWLIFYWKNTAFARLREKETSSYNFVRLHAIQSNFIAARDDLFICPLWITCLCFSPVWAQRGIENQRGNLMRYHSNILFGIMVMIKAKNQPDEVRTMGLWKLAHYREKKVDEKVDFKRFRIEFTFFRNGCDTNQ